VPKVDLWLDSEDIASAQQSNSFNFEVPVDAVKKGNLDDPNDDKAKATWMQALDIVEVKFYEDETAPTQKDASRYDCVTAEIKFQVPADATRSSGAADPNAGRSTTVWYRVVPAAMKNKNHAKYKANNFALGNLNGILRSIWGSSVFPHGASANLGDFYGSENGADAPVVGKRVLCTVKQSKYEGNKKDELRDFVPQESQK